MTRVTPPVGRLAPSPTGALHLGNARTFLLAWLSVRARGGHVVMRIEDIDSPRVKHGSLQQTLDDLRWLGLDWDSGPDCGGPAGPYVQTQCMTRYEQALRVLLRQERVYPCTCSRSDVAQAASAPHLGQEPPPYPRTCAHRRTVDAERLRAADQPFSWRFRTSPQELSWEDRLLGRQSAHPAQDLGDFVVAKANGQPAYQLAVVVDDHHMQITEVVRGQDLTPSTFRQCELIACFGWDAPEYAHVPLIIGSDGRRLAKRHGDTRLCTLREAGGSPEQLVGFLAWSCGLLRDPVSARPGDLVQGFRWEHVARREAFVFDRERYWPLLTGQARWTS